MGYHSVLYLGMRMTDLATIIAVLFMFTCQNARVKDETKTTLVRLLSGLKISKQKDQNQFTLNSRPYHSGQEIIDHLFMSDKEIDTNEKYGEGYLKMNKGIYCFVWLR